MVPHTVQGWVLSLLPLPRSRHLFGCYALTVQPDIFLWVSTANCLHFPPQASSALRPARLCSIPSPLAVKPTPPPSVLVPARLHPKLAVCLVGSFCPMSGTLHSPLCCPVYPESVVRVLMLAFSGPLCPLPLPPSDPHPRMHEPQGGLSPTSFGCVLVMLFVSKFVVSFRAEHCSPAEMF